MNNDEISNEDLLRKAHEAGFESIEDFVRANLHYLPGWKQKLFSLITLSNHR